MKKVLIIHGFEGTPNGGWRPWLMGELEKMDIYACSLAMPTPDAPVCGEWVSELSRQIEMSNSDDEIYLAGHSLGVPAILRYLETDDARKIAGIVLVAAPSEKTQNKATENFYETSYDYELIKTKIGAGAVIHGDNDPYVPLSNAKDIASGLGVDLIVIENGGHLNGSSGFLALPQCLEILSKMIKE